MDMILWNDGSLVEIDRRSALSEHEALAARFTRLSSWMMILGTVRLVSAVGDYGSSFLDITSSWYPSLRDIARFFQENPPAVLLGSGWPLILGLLLRKPTNRGFVAAGYLTFFILSLGGFLGLLASISMRSVDAMIWIGSFAIARGSLQHGNLAATILALMGTLQLAMELVTAGSAWALSQSLRTEDASKSTQAEGSRRGLLYGRLAIYLSLAFFVPVVRQPLWSAYVTVLNQSNLFREFVLKNDSRAAPRRPAVNLAYPSPPADGDNPVSLPYAMQLAATKRFQEAKKTYLQIISQAQYNARGPRGAEIRVKELAPALNNLAWMLATCEDVQFRAPEESLEYARKAVQLAADEGMYWNTLGVAYFRQRNWDEAANALGRSMELRENGEGDSFDWFFLAMIQASKNQQAAGRLLYNKAVAWFHQNRAGDEELYQFQVEAARALGLSEPSAPLVTTKTKPVEIAKPARMRRGFRFVP